MEKPPNRKLGLIIITYNNLCNTLCVLDSVTASDCKDKETLVIDNCSAPEYRDRLQNVCKEKFPDTKILYLEKEYGYGGACNIGAKYFIEKGINVFLFLNNDVILHPHCISQLLTNLDEDNVLIGPKVYYNFSDRIYSAGGFFNKTFMIVKNRGNGQFDKGQYDKKEKVEFINGCAFLVSAKVFAEMNGFDENFYYYSEESDLCFRIINAGHKIIYEPKAVAYHWVSTTFGNESKKSIYYLVRSNLYFASKYSPNIIIFFNHCLYLLYEYVIMLVLRRFAYIFTRVVVVLRAVKDFIMKKTGK
ncbi:MAG: glycosyltransferase family 2 protein [Candidatus Omnitrophota bacterium]